MVVVSAALMAGSLLAPEPEAKVLLGIVSAVMLLVSLALTPNPDDKDGKA